MKTALKQHMQVFQEACRQKNLRVTPQRMEIYGNLALAADHPSAEMLYQRLVKKMPTLSLDTVYRTLATLVEHGLVKRVETVESQARFEIAQSQHHHLICKRCNCIEDFHADMIDEEKLAQQLQNWGRVETKHFVIYGICNHCLGYQGEHNSQ